MFLFQFKVPIGQDEEGEDMEELVLPKSDAESDIVLDLNGNSPFKIGASARIEIHIVGGKIREFTWMVSQVIAVIVPPVWVCFFPTLYCISCYIRNFSLFLSCLVLSSGNLILFGVISCFVPSYLNVTLLNSSSIF